MATELDWLNAAFTGALGSARVDAVVGVTVLVVVTFGAVVVLVVDVVLPAPPDFEPDIEGVAALATDASPATKPATISATAPADESRPLVLPLATSTNREDGR